MSDLPYSIKQQLPDASAYWVALSGGLDSSVLLHVLASMQDSLSGPLGAVHVDHQLQACSADWDEQCRVVCASLGIRYQGLQVDVDTEASAGPEAAARDARYAALRQWLPEKALLLTAHHERDQAETLLLQLLRGAGSRGLSAMPVISDFAAGRLLRPMLLVSHTQIREYAETHALTWIEDPSNASLTFDRNFLRHQIFPLLQQRWPSTERLMARAAGHQAESAMIAAELADIDLESCQIVGQEELSIMASRRLSMLRQKNLLRHWIHKAGYLSPSAVVLARLINEVIQGREDAKPLVRWSTAEVRRYRDAVYLMEQANPPMLEATYDWQPDQTLQLPHGQLTLESKPGAGLSPNILKHGVRVGFRQGGEKLLPANRQHRQTLKALFQDAGIPPWHRQGWPLVFQGDRLIAVAGVCVVEGFQASVGESGRVLRWRPDMG
ncbi:MAG: tRNA lysidine(34) synthetase TilS [Gammaproteobacteria bacterium]